MYQYDEHKELRILIEESNLPDIMKQILHDMASKVDRNSYEIERVSNQVNGVEDWS